MRAFHSGGAAGADIAHGLPRVVELFEARKPKGLAMIAEVDGKVSVEESDKALSVTITDSGGEEHKHTLPPRTPLFVEHRQKGEAGTPLHEGAPYPAELLADPGPTATALYMVQWGQQG